MQGGNTISAPISTEEKQKKTRKGKAAALQLGIVGVIVILIGISFLVKVLAPPTPSGVPGVLADMKLGSFVGGTQALAQVNQLHGTSIDLADAYVAVYSHDFNPYHSDRARVTAWVGTAKTGDAASALLGRMVAGMSNNNTPFTKPQLVRVGSYSIYQASGLNGEHFFYQSPNDGKKVVWLTVEEAGNTMFLVEQALDEF
jgi:hypothetical protein